MADAKDAIRTCVRCGKPGRKDDQYCTGCGAPLVNRCLDPGGLLEEPCGYVNDRSAAYCARCGSYTAFHKAGLVFSPHPENKVLAVDELAEMNWFRHPFFLAD